MRIRERVVRMNDVLKQARAHNLAELRPYSVPFSEDGERLSRALKGRVRGRSKRCYELTGRIMVGCFGDGPTDQLRLVHGERRSSIAWIDHAWILLPSGRVYDPVYDMEFEAEAYDCRAERIYTAVEAARLMNEHG